MLTCLPVGTQVQSIVQIMMIHDEKMQEPQVIRAIDKLKEFNLIQEDGNDDQIVL